MNNKHIKLLTFLFAVVISTTNVYANSYNIDATELLNRVEYISSMQRACENEEKNTIREYIINDFNDAGLETLIQEFDVVLHDSGNTVKGKNIIGTFKPNESISTGEILIVGAHYDAVENSPGANDNASGLSVMLELVKMITNKYSDTEVRFIAFDYEERGLLGSQYYVEHLGEEIDNVIGMINFDMLASINAQSVKVYSGDGESNFLFDILKTDNQFPEEKIEKYSGGISDSQYFHIKTIPTLWFSHPIVLEQYYFPNNDTIENIDAKKLQVAASAGWEIISTIISPDTKPFMEVSKPLYDNSIYQINSSTFLPMNVDKKTFEQESGIKLTQIPGDNNCVYQSQVYLFNIKKPVTLSVYSDDFYGIISNINAVISETDIAFNEIYNELAKEFGTPKVNGNIYEWYSAYGNIYKINLYDGYCTINVENYLNTPNEGYAIDNEKLVTLNDSNGIINILVSKRNDKISYEVSGSVRDENSTPSEKAVLVLEKLKDVLSYEELEKINFLNIGTDGIGGSETFRLSEYYNNIYDIETLNKDIELIEKELPGDFENVSLSYNIAGTHLYIDYIDLLHHQGDCYNIRDARTAFELARSMCTNGRDIPSVWAMDAVARSIKGNFLPSYMQTQYQKPITREDFCTIVYEWLKLKKVELEMYDAKTHFKDTENHSVNVLFELGIINGKDNELFGPTDQITREQAASILNRLLSLFENNMPTILYTFADDLSISNYARNSVYNMYEKNIMNGIGDELFAPQDTFTKEQAIVTLIRLNDYMS